MASKNGNNPFVCLPAPIKARKEQKKTPERKILRPVFESLSQVFSRTLDAIASLLKALYKIFRLQARDFYKKMAEYLSEE